MEILIFTMLRTIKGFVCVCARAVRIHKPTRNYILSTINGTSSRFSTCDKFASFLNAFFSLLWCFFYRGGDEVYIQNCDIILDNSNHRDYYSKQNSNENWATTWGVWKRVSETSPTECLWISFTAFLRHFFISMTKWKIFTKSSMLWVVFFSTLDLDFTIEVGRFLYTVR